MLVMFECTVVMQRQKNLRELRALQTPKQRLHVYRGGKWEVRVCTLPMGGHMEACRLKVATAHHPARQSAAQQSCNARP